MPTEITDTFLAAYERAGARVERVFFPGRPPRVPAASRAPTPKKTVALMSDFIAHL